MLTEPPKKKEERHPKHHNTQASNSTPYQLTETATLIRHPNSKYGAHLIVPQSPLTADAGARLRSRHHQVDQIGNPLIIRSSLPKSIERGKHDTAPDLVNTSQRRTDNTRIGGALDNIVQPGDDLGEHSVQVADGALCTVDGVVGDASEDFELVGLVAGVAEGVTGLLLEVGEREAAGCVEEVVDEGNIRVPSLEGAEDIALRRLLAAGLAGHEGAGSGGCGDGGGCESEDGGGDEGLHFEGGVECEDFDEVIGI